MRRSSKKLSSVLAALLVCVMVVSAAGLAAAVSPSPEVGNGSTGSITILPQYGSRTVSGGAFRLYYIASPVDGTSFEYSLFGAFAAAEDVDINADIKKAQDAAAAAQRLSGYIPQVDETVDRVYSLSRDDDGDTVGGCPWASILSCRRLCRPSPGAETIPPRPRFSYSSPRRNGNPASRAGRPLSGGTMM